MGQTTKKIKGKIIFKHQTAAEWEQSSYVPDIGERVLYDPDGSHNYTREKFGDGKKRVHDLPFAQTASISGQSTYEYATGAGYEGTEEQFKTAFLSALSGGGAAVPVYDGSVEGLSNGDN